MELSVRMPKNDAFYFGNFSGDKSDRNVFCTGVSTGTGHVSIINTHPGSFTHPL